MPKWTWSSTLPGIINQDPRAAEHSAWSGLDVFTGRPGNTSFSVSYRSFFRKTCLFSCAKS